MIVQESPNHYANPRYVIADDLTISDYIDADAHRTEQAPDRNNIIIIDGWAYVRDHDVPLDLLWRKGAA